MPKPISPERKRREEARAKLGYSVQEVCDWVGVGPKHLREVERQGRASYGLATVLSQVYQCPMEWFI